MTECLLPLQLQLLLLLLLVHSTPCCYQGPPLQGHALSACLGAHPDRQVHLATLPSCARLGALCSSQAETAAGAGVPMQCAHSDHAAVYCSSSRALALHGTAARSVLRCSSVAPVPCAASSSAPPPRAPATVPAPAYIAFCTITQSQYADHVAQVQKSCLKSNIVMCQRTKADVLVHEHHVAGRSLLFIFWYNR